MYGCLLGTSCKNGGLPYRTGSNEGLTRHAKRWNRKSEADLDMASCAVVRLVLHNLAANQLLGKVRCLCHLLHIIPHQNACAALHDTRNSAFMNSRTTCAMGSICIILLEEQCVGYHLYIWEVLGEGLNVVLGVGGRAFLRADTHRNIEVLILFAQSSWRRPRTHTRREGLTKRMSSSILSPQRMWKPMVGFSAAARAFIWLSITL